MSRAMARGVRASNDQSLAKLAVAAAAGDDSAAAMLRDELQSKYPMQGVEFGTFIRVGGHYQIRTVSDYWTGIVLAATASEILLGTAAWIPDTGRLSDALASGDYAEREPIPGGVMVIDRQCVCAYIPLAHEPSTERRPA